MQSRDIQDRGVEIERKCMSSVALLPAKRIKNRYCTVKFI